MSNTKRDTIDMARETKMPYDFVTGQPIYLEKLKAFEALVRADERSVEREQDIQRLSALVRAQQITIDKLEAQWQSVRSTWVGLTDEEKITMSGYDLHYAALIGQIERKLKEKNSD